jgi:hypothetical protein
MEEADKKPTLREAASIYLATLQPEERQEAQPEVQKFVRWYGADRNMSDLKPHDVSGYAAGLGVGLTDAAGRIEPVRAFLSFARKKKFTTENMAVHLRSPKALKATRARSMIEEAQIELTPEGIAGLEAELQELRSRRPQITADLRRAMADKDFRENAPLDAAREQQAHMKGASGRRISVEAGRRSRGWWEGAKGLTVGGSAARAVAQPKSGAEVKYAGEPARWTQVDESHCLPVGKRWSGNGGGMRWKCSTVGNVRFRIEASGVLPPDKSNLTSM